MTIFLTVDQAITVHDRLIEQHGGLPGIRNIGLLTSAMEMPKSAFGGVEICPTLYDKAAAYLFYITKNHPFNDGNKRTASFLAVLFLRLNGIKISINQKEYELLIIGTAESLVTKIQISSFFMKCSKKAHSKKIQKQIKHKKKIR